MFVLRIDLVRLSQSKRSLRYCESHSISLRIHIFALKLQLKKIMLGSYSVSQPHSSVYLVIKSCK